VEGTFGDLLRRHRVAAGLSQEALAERAGLSRRGLSDLERGARRAPYGGTVLHLADALALSQDERKRLMQASLRRAKGASTSTEVEASPLGLPRSLSSFVGRQRDLARIKDLVKSNRLLTLTGTGGIGKTRLALQVALDLAEAYPQGVRFVDLASVANPALVPDAVVTAMGMQLPFDAPILGSLIETLRPLRLLVVLDNCEHLKLACAQLADHLLRGCPQLSIMATSREPLGIFGETVWRVPSLSIPEGDGPASALELEHSDAARLFIERARSIMPQFALSDSNAQRVAEICRRLDGIPLALELAAARVSMLSTGQIADRLNDSLRLLTSGAPTAPSRQQTLRATIDWSYGLLSDLEGELFKRLSVFAGGWTLEAAEAICPGTGIKQDMVLELLGNLVSKSLVRVQTSLAGPYRYALLEVLRQYASERLAEDPEAAETSRQRHAEYFLTLRYQLASGALRPNSWDVERENANLAAALAWSVKTGRARVRRAARVIILDPLQRVLLFRNEDAVPSNPDDPEIRRYWFIPGGGAQLDETFEQAALREMREETGITGVSLGPCVWLGQYAAFLYGEPVLADERYYLVRTPTADVDTSGLQPHERSNWREFRWWTIAELRATTETIRPDGFVDFLEPLLMGQIPSPPVGIFGDRELREAIAAASGAH
jgi:predicted ATPase/DNA-binding XRE family transcriptional regulator